jgi:hypothetical protein
MDELRRKVPSAFQSQPHHSRSHRYAFVDTGDVIKGMLTAGYVPYFAVQSRSRTVDKQDYTKHMIKFGHPDNMGGLHVGDSLPLLAMINSHDGSSAYELESALFRLVCSNGLMVAGKQFSSVKVYHKGNIVDNVIDGSYQVIQESEKALTASVQWGQLQLTDGEQKLFADAVHDVRFADSDGKITTPIKAEQLLQARRAHDGIQTAGYRLGGVYGFAKTDLWHTLNVVQENVIKGGLHGVRNPGTRERRRVTTRQVNGIDQDVRLNKAIWMFAEKLAEMKGQ